MNGNDFCAGTVLRKDAIYKCELYEVLQVGCDIGSSYAKEVSRNVVVADSFIHVKRVYCVNNFITSRYI